MAARRGWAVERHRPARYALVSAAAGALAQLGLLVAYGVFGWSTAAASVFSLAVSVGPSYWGSRTYVWSGRERREQRRQAVSFVVVAVLGTATAVALTGLAERAGASVTTDRALLAAWVSAGSVGATVLVWITRYTVLDRFVFPAPRP